jgi:hypothetical protein
MMLAKHLQTHRPCRAGRRRIGGGSLVARLAPVDIGSQSIHNGTTA